MTGHSRLSAPHNGVVPRRDVRRRHACAHFTVWTAVVPDWNVDGNADDRPRRRAEHIRCSDVDIRTC